MSKKIHLIESLEKKLLTDTIYPSSHQQIKTLNTAKQRLLKKDPIQALNCIKQFFYEHWAYVNKTGQTYDDFSIEINRLYFALAHAFNPDKPQCLLMPHLKHAEDGYGWEFSTIDFHDAIVLPKSCGFIHIESILDALWQRYEAGETDILTYLDKDSVLVPLEKSSQQTIRRLFPELDDFFDAISSKRKYPKNASNKPLLLHLQALRKGLLLGDAGHGGLSGLKACANAK